MDGARDVPDHATVRLQLLAPASAALPPLPPSPMAAAGQQLAPPSPATPYYSAQLELRTQDGGTAEGGTEECPPCGKAISTCAGTSLKRAMFRAAIPIAGLAAIAVIVSLQKWIGADVVSMDAIVHTIKSELEAAAAGVTMSPRVATNAV